MNILLLGLPHLTSALRQPGHMVCNVGLHAQCDVQLTAPLTLNALLQELARHGFTPDISLYVDPGNLPFILNMERMPCPSLFYSIDTFCNPWHIPYSYAFDYSFIAQKDYLDLFIAEQRPASWLPLSFTLSPSAVQPEWHDRTLTISFVGTLNPPNIPDRLPFLHRFNEILPVHFRQGDFQPIFTQSQIVLNQSAAAEVNFRCFEATACGAALLTEDIQNGLSELFTPGVTMLPPYPRADARQAARIAAHWLARPKALERIARAGQEHCADLHSNEARAARILHVAHELRARHEHEQRLAALPQRSIYLASAYGFLCAELPPHLEPHRELYFQAYLQASGK